MLGRSDARTGKLRAEEFVRVVGERALSRRLVFAIVSAGVRRGNRFLALSFGHRVPCRSWGEEGSPGRRNDEEGGAGCGREAAAAATEGEVESEGHRGVIDEGGDQSTEGRRQGPIDPQATGEGQAGGGVRELQQTRGNGGCACSLGEKAFAK